MFFDEAQILNHAHLVALFVPVVKSFQSVAWKASAFKTVSHFAIQQFGTLLFNESAFFVSRSTTYAIRNFNALAFQIIFQRQVAGAKCAVHSAGRD